jgi:peptidoglycan/xylan/chitin deacetylase (PgdA/CDA1 family)
VTSSGVRVAVIAVLAATGLLHGVTSAPPAHAADDCPPPIGTVLDQTPSTLPRNVALTFDDGPSPRWTPQLLDVLREHGVTATFFLIGSNVDAHPELARRILAEGHVIGDHTYTHPELDQLSRADQAAEIDRGAQAIENATGVRPCFFRGPYGIHRSASVTELAWERGMTIADWSHDTRDWETPSSDSAAFQDAIVQRATDWVTAHPIILMHDGGPDSYRGNTVEAVDRIVSFYASGGYVFTDPAGRPFESMAGTYVVRPGDTLSTIAAGLGTSWRSLYAANREVIGADPNLLRSGQTLVVGGAAAGPG